MDIFYRQKEDLGKGVKESPAITGWRTFLTYNNGFDLSINDTIVIASSKSNIIELFKSLKAFHVNLLLLIQIITFAAKLLTICGSTAS